VSTGVKRSDSMRVMLALCLSAVIVPVLLCGISEASRRWGHYPPMYGNFDISPYLFEGPGGSYGFYTYPGAEEEFRKKYGAGCVMMVAGRRFKVPMTPSHVLLVALGTGVTVWVAVAGLDARRNGSEYITGRSGA
jgi:hypothetical protein